MKCKHVDKDAPENAICEDCQFNKLVMDMAWLRKWEKKVPKEMHYKFYYLNGFINGMKGGKDDNKNN